MILEKKIFRLDLMELGSDVLFCVYILRLSAACPNLYGGHQASFRFQCAIAGWRHVNSYTESGFNAPISQNNMFLEGSATFAPESTGMGATFR